MQTFLPYDSFAQSAACLDNRRLGKQLVEVVQIYNATMTKNGWSNHPAVLMWQGHMDALLFYGYAINVEWEYRWCCGERGGKSFHRCGQLVLDKLSEMGFLSMTRCLMPPWLGRENFHSSHRAALMAKDPVWYGKFGWTETPKIEYVWPV